MPQYPPVTIITPVYNNVDRIAETIESVLIQNYPNLNYIVVDAGSTDGTLQRLEHYRKRVTIFAEQGTCLKKAINHGIAMATSDVVCILHAGDRVNAGLIESAMGRFSRKKDLVAVYPDWFLVNASGQTIEKIETQDYALVSMLEEHYTIPGVGAFFRKSQLMGMAPHDMRYGASSDYEMWLRLGLMGPMERIPRFLATRCNSSSSKTAPDLDSAKAQAITKVQVVQDLYTRRDLPQELVEKRSQAMSAAYYQAGVTVARQKGGAGRRYMMYSLAHKVRWPDRILLTNRRKFGTIVYAMGQPFTFWADRLVKKLFRKSG